MSLGQARTGYQGVTSEESVVVASGGSTVSVNTVITQGQPYPWLIDGRTGEYLWDPEDPTPEYDDQIFATTIVTLLDHKGRPDMTLDRKVVALWALG